MAGDRGRLDRTGRPVADQPRGRADRRWPPGRRDRRAHAARRLQAGDGAGRRLSGRGCAAGADAQYRRLDHDHDQLHRRARGMSVAAVLVTNAAVLAALFVLAWLACLKMRDVTPVDSLWALGMVAMAAATIVQTGGDRVRKELLLALCAQR